MDTYVATIFTDATAEFADIQSASPSIDFLDFALTPALVPTFTSSPNFQITSSSAGGFAEIEFLLANNFWGVNFNYGNDLNGVQVRQGIWHMIDTASFAANQPMIAGQAQAADNPETIANGGLLPANPCAWDSSFPESGPNCIVGAPGGTAYHLGPASGAGGFVWDEAPGSLDMNAAAQHFVNAGIATGFNPTTSVLTGVSSGAAAHPVSFFIRNDNPTLLDLGDSLSEQICYLFTGSYNVPCSYLSITRGPITAFPGITTSSTNVNLSWGMYTSGIATSGALGDPALSGGAEHPHTDMAVDPFDGTLYFTFNSNFVNGNPNIVSPSGFCSLSSLHGGSSSANYMYLCNQPYDSISSQVEFAKCVTVSGDPISGSTNNNSTATCSGGGLSAIGAGIEAENSFGKRAYTIPIYAKTNQFGFLNNGFIRVVNSLEGTPNFFTNLDTFNPRAPVAGAFRVGFAQTTRSVNPYVASTVWDAMIIGNIYDSLIVGAPLSPDPTSNSMNWMVLAVQQLPNTSLTYTPPTGTQQTFRFTLRTDLFFQDTTAKVTSFDVAFSYLSMLASGAFQGGGLEPMTGVTILGPEQFDINVNGVGPFTFQALSGTTIVPGEYWTFQGASNWNSVLSTCTSTTSSCYPAQYTLNPASGAGSVPQVSCSLSCTFGAKFMNVDPIKMAPSFDPIAASTLIGSGPWMCLNTSTGKAGSGCSSSGSMNPPVGGSYILSRFGKGLAPGSSISSEYFRSNGNLALYLWSQDTGDITHDFLNFSVVASCFGAAVTSSGSCAHFQQGIGANGGPVSVGLSQVAIVNRFVGLNWTAPFSWLTSPPPGIVSLDPVLYENTITLNPASVAGCTLPYPTGGYDC